MSIEQLLGHRAIVEAPVTETDRLGQPSLVSWEQQFGGAVPCRYDNPSGQEARLSLEQEGEVHELSLKLFFGPTHRLWEHFRIASVTNTDGVELATNLDVIHVSPAFDYRGRVHHFEVLAQRYR